MAEIEVVRDWILRGQEDQEGGVLRVPVHPLPFRVGRLPGAHLRLASSRVSHRHAELFERGGVLWLRDRDSTNGTFVNGEPVSERPLKEGDILHFADQQFRLEALESEPMSMETVRFTTTLTGPHPGPIRHTRELVELLRTKAVRVEFQPLVQLCDGAVVAYEALGRGDLPGAPSSPAELLRTAESLGLAAELSAVFRECGLSYAAKLPPSSVTKRPAIFVNTHPAEMDAWEALLDSLRNFRRHEPTLPVVLEIHESAVTDIATFRTLREQLNELDVGQAFDDFGTGQARLDELCEVSPDYVKFDLKFARDLHEASEKRREMVRSLVRMMADMKITTVVEGVETAEEAEVCRSLGFDLAQGYFFGRPAPLERL